MKKVHLHWKNGGVFIYIGSFLLIFFLAQLTLPGITAHSWAAHITPEEQFCRTCHGSSTANQHHVIPAYECIACHPVINIGGYYEIPAERDCTICHGDYFNNHMYGNDHLYTEYDPLTDLAQEAPGTPCAVCHNDSGGDLATWPDVRTEHDVPTNGAGPCDTCHHSDRVEVQMAINNGQLEETQNCLDCHSDKETPETHGYVPHEPPGYVTKYPSCVVSGCHDGEEVVLDIHEGKCDNCHTQVPGLKPGLSSGNCINCHTDPDVHHDTPQSQGGYCTWCHADPRPAIDPTAPTGQLACVQCHGPYQHDNGGPIQDYGACFACHMPEPFHAKPMQTPECWKIMQGSPYYDPNLAPGKDSYNIFAQDLQYQNSFWGGTPFENEADMYCAPISRSDFWYPEIAFNCVTITNFLGSNQQWVVPTFEAGDGTSCNNVGSNLGPGGQPPPPQNDSVNITWAEYDSSTDRLTVYATNTLGNSNGVMLTVNYNGSSYEMNWSYANSRWEATISDSTCNDPTIEVFSSAGGSDTSNVSNCSIPPNDSVNITRAEYDDDRNRLTVYAVNTLGNGNGVMLTVHYDGNSYAMNWDNYDNRWEKTISDYRCKDSTIEVVSSAGGSDSSSVSNCSVPPNDSVNITRAEYDNSSSRLTVYAENSLGSNATLSVLYNGNSYEMDRDYHDNRWEIRINDSSCSDSTIEVESSAGGGDSSPVSNCSVPPNDSVNITRAEYDEDRERLTVYAENALGNNDATLSVYYDGDSYEMNWSYDHHRWEVRINDSHCNDSTIEVFSTAVGIDSSPVSNCSH